MLIGPEMRDMNQKHGTDVDHVIIYQKDRL